MSDNIIEVQNETEAGAKINLSITLSPEDCFTMCKELFERLSLKEKDVIILKYLNETATKPNLI